MSHKPSGAIGFVHKTRTFYSRAIAKHERLPYGHAAIALGNGKAFEQPFFWSKMKSDTWWEKHDEKVDWWAPVQPFTPDQTRVLRSAAYLLRGRTFYDVPALFRLAGVGKPGRGHGLFCSYLIAELYLTARDYDFSGAEKPWLVGLRDMWVALQDPADWYPLNGALSIKTA